MRIYTFLLVFMFSIGSYAQTATTEVCGYVKDEQGMPLEFATVALLEKDDSTVVTGGLTDAEGKFCLHADSGHDGQLIRVSSVGYATAYAPLPLHGAIVMKADAKELDEVTITSARKHVKSSATGLIVNMEGNPLSKLPTAEDAIKLMPLIDASKQSISVLGKGSPVIYINNRKLRNYSELKSMSPENIKSVEIITAPSVKYGSEVTSVIIVHTKRLDSGFAGRLSGTGQFAEVASAWGNADFSYMLPNGLGFYANGSISNDKYRQKRTYDEYFDNDRLHTLTNGTYHGNSLSMDATLGGSYDFGKTNSVGVRYQFSRTPKSTYHADSRIGTNVEGAEMQMESDNRQKTQSMRHYVNAYATFKFGRKKNYELSADADYLYGTENNGQRTMEESGADDRLVSTYNSAAYHLIATKANLNIDLGKFSVDLGGEYSHTTNRTYFDSGNSGITGERSDDDTRQNLAAGYVNISYSPNKHWQLIGGLRVETTNFTYYQNGIRVDEQSRSYTDWLPKFVASYSNGDWRLNLSYGKRVYRPSYSMLNSNYVYVSHTSWETGNPLLRPTKPISVDLSLYWKQTILMVSYVRSKKNIESVYTYLPTENVNIRKYVNLPDFDILSFVLSQSFDIGFWHPTVQGALALSNLKYGSPQLKYNKPLGQLSLSNRLDLPWGIYAYVTASWMSNGHNTLYYFYDNSSVSLRLNKSVGNWNFNIYANDILGTWKQEYTTDTNGVNVYEYRKGASRSVSLSVSYSFNRKKKKSYKSKGTGSSELQRF